MYYCEKCHYIFDVAECNNCGCNQLREACDEDFCYLTTVEERFGEMLIGCFQNENINCVAVPVGDGVRSNFGLSLGNFRLYVPYKNLNEASEIIEFFNSNNSMNILRENILNNIDKWHFESNKIEAKIRKKLMIAKEADLIECIKKKVEQAQSIDDVGLMNDNEHGLVVKSEGVILWFSSDSFKINV